MTHGTDVGFADCEFGDHDSTCSRALGRDCYFETTSRRCCATCENLKTDNPSESMMTSSNGNICRFTGLLWRESTGHRWIPLTRASDAKFWCLLWSIVKHMCDIKSIATIKEHIFFLTAYIAKRAWLLRHQSICINTWTDLLTGGRGHDYIPLKCRKGNDI